jgi:uncharacterized protein
MGEEDRQIVLELKRRLPVEVRARLARLILYGSRARGEAAEDSDLDLIALVDVKTPELEAQMEEVAYSVMWDHDFKPIISLKIFGEERFRSAEEKGYSFYRNVTREGIEL